MLYVGIDNGLNGGIVVVNDKEEIVFKLIMPIIKGERKTYDLKELGELLESYTPHNLNEECLFIVEKAHARFVSGAAQSFSTGYCYGIIQGMLSVLGLSYVIVDPKIWQKDILGPVSDDTKQASILYVTKKYPNENFKASERCSKYHDGLTDACCLALYGCRKHKVL